MTFATIVLEAALVVVSIAIVLTFARLLLGPTLPDRVIAFDLLTIQVLGMICILSIMTGRTLLLDITFVLALLTFLATLAFARHIERTARDASGGQSND